MADKNYTTIELADIFKVSPRTIQRHLASITDELSNNSKGYKIPELIALYIANKYGYNFTEEDNDRQNVRAEYFTEEEYQEFHRRLSEYPLLKDYIKTILNELDYHKKSAESHQRQMEMILSNLQQRNYIEAKDKKID